MCKRIRLLASLQVASQMCKWPARCPVEQSPMYLHDVKEVSLCLVCAHLHLEIEANRKKKIGRKKRKQKTL